MKGERRGGEQRGLRRNAPAALCSRRRGDITVSPSSSKLAGSLVEEVLDLLRRVEPLEQAASRRASAARAMRCDSEVWSWRAQRKRIAPARRSRPWPPAPQLSGGPGVPRSGPGVGSERHDRCSPRSRAEGNCYASLAQRQEISSYFPPLIAVAQNKLLFNGSWHGSRPQCPPLSRPSPIPRRSRKRTSPCSTARWGRRARCSAPGWRASWPASSWPRGQAQPAAPARPAEPLTIVYASECGNCEKLAGDMAKDARKLGFKPRLIDMADLELGRSDQGEAPGRHRRHLGRGRAAGARGARL